MWNKIKRVVDLHATDLLSAAAIGGFISGTVLAVRSTPEAVRILDVAGDLGSTPKQRVANTVKLLAPLYAPSVAMILISSACVIGANHISNRRYAAVSSLYAITQKTLEMWQVKTLESVGDKKYNHIADEVAKPTWDPVMIVSGDSVLCYDKHSDRYFKADSVETIRHAVNDLNERLSDELVISLNDFYYDIGLGPVGNGDDIGWTIDNGMLHVEYRPVMTPDNKPCVSIIFKTSPKHVLS